MICSFCGAESEIEKFRTETGPSGREETEMPDGGIFSIGHSTHPLDRFVGLLMRHGIDMVADVRSMPFSRFNPQFDRDSLCEALRRSNMKYAFFGRELGARTEDPSCHGPDGKVRYDRLAARKNFKLAIARLIEGARDHRIALMCAEKEPLDCHRAILVSQELYGKGCEVWHILDDGSLEPHEAALERLLDAERIPRMDLFRSKKELLDEALSRREARIAQRARRVRTEWRGASE